MVKMTVVCGPDIKGIMCTSGRIIIIKGTNLGNICIRMPSFYPLAAYVCVNVEGRVLSLESGGPVSPGHLMSELREFQYSPSSDSARANESLEPQPHP